MKTKNILIPIILPLIILLSGCDKIEFKRAEDIVKSNMRDPESATFRNLRISHNGSICGEVNGKNAFGAMAGYRSFYLEKDGMIPYIEPSLGEETENFERGYTCACFEKSIREEGDRLRGWPKRACPSD